VAFSETSHGGGMVRFEKVPHRRSGTALWRCGALKAHLPAGTEKTPPQNLLDSTLSPGRQTKVARSGTRPQMALRAEPAGTDLESSTYESQPKIALPVPGFIEGLNIIRFA
jgi:hypothetical protein